MSADNWTYCPKCKEAWHKSQERASNKISKMYGKVPAEEYLAALKSFNDSEAIVFKETLREDYDIGIDGNSFYVSFQASCRECGFAFEFKHEVVVYK